MFIKNNLKEKPASIVSLVPSITELLFNLGLDEEVTGITKFCVHPPQWLKTKTRIGGTKNINIEKIKSLSPTLIIANKEENIKEQIEELETFAPVWITDISTYANALQMIKDCAIITAKEKEATELIEKIKFSFTQLQTANTTHQIPNNKPAVLYLIWRKPYMTIGHDTFVHDMLCTAGFANTCSNLKRYPVLSVEEIVAANPSHILLSSEPFPFKQKHIGELQQYVPQAKIILVNGEMFSWYGSRMLYAAAYFKTLQQQL